MSTQQWEIGHGRVWTFEATEIVTSGTIVQLEVGKVKPVQAATNRPVGVVLFPASVGKLAAVALDMVVYVNTTGAAAGVTLSGGCYVCPATQGKATYFSAPSGTADWSTVLGKVIEGTALNTRAKVKLIW